MKEASHNEKNWRNIASVIWENRHRIRSLLTDEEQRIRIQFFCMYVIFCFVSTFMTVVNVFTGWYLLMLSTLVFAIVNLINILLCLVNRSCEHFSRVCFAIEFVALFVFFCICGEPEGFSAIWMALLPACGLLLYRLKFGVILSLGQFLILIFLFWTKTGNSLLQYNYTESFLMRFPMLYMAFFMVGALFEYIRSATQKELTETRAQYEYLSNHDILTGLYNRFGFNSSVSEMMKDGETHDYAIAIADIDDFKIVNDTYGHYNGDIVLKEVARVFSETVGGNGTVSRWGGEEFSVLFTCAADCDDICGRIQNAVRALEFNFEGRSCGVTISIGLVKFNTGSENDISHIFTAADSNLYTAKKSGKDRAITSDL